MSTVPGKYTWIERSFEEPKPIKEKEEEDVIIPDSKLEPEVQVRHSRSAIPTHADLCDVGILQHDLLYRVRNFIPFDSTKLTISIDS
jgi:hypothetical protein